MNAIQAPVLGWGNDILVSTLLVSVTNTQTKEHEDVFCTSILALKRQNPFKIKKDFHRKMLK